MRVYKFHHQRKRCKKLKIVKINNNHQLAFIMAKAIFLAKIETDLYIKEYLKKIK